MPYLSAAARPPIVLLHSSMSSKSQWRELIESMSDSYRLIAIDLLGYGESTLPRGSYSLDDEVSLVESVLARELHPGEPFHLVGHSYGGIVALQLAARSRPPGLRSLSLFEPIAFHLLRDRDPDRLVVQAAWREMEGKLKLGDTHGAAACFVDYWSGAGTFAQLRETRQSVLASQVPKVLREFRAVADGACNAEAYRRIEVPVCLVAGHWSPEPAQRLTSLLAGLLPQAACFEVAAGHMAPITHPDLVNPVLRRFIREVDESAVAAVNPRFRDSAAEHWNTFGNNLARAAAFGLSGLVLSVLPLFLTQSKWQGYFAIPPAVAYPLEEGAWHEAPPGLPPGGTFAVVAGDPREPGPFVMRVRLPPGYTLPPYRRRKEEQIIVLAGDITLGTRTLTSGSYALLPANEIHSAKTAGGATLQIFGIGPFEIEYPS